MFLDDVPQTPADGGMASDDTAAGAAGEDVGEAGDAKDKPDDDSEEGGAAL